MDAGQRIEMHSVNLLVASEARLHAAFEVPIAIQIEWSFPNFQSTPLQYP